MEKLYYIYENWRRKRGRIHLAGCGYCNDGRGTQPEDSGKNGRWHGPLDGAEAFAVVKRLRTSADIQPLRRLQPVTRPYQSRRIAGFVFG
jgi:hypothetical protein